MSEWVDCLVFCFQAAVLWIALPRWCGRFAGPLLWARNPQWAAAHPEILAGLAAGGGLRFLQAWGLLSVLALIAAQFGLPSRLRTLLAPGMPQWRVLATLSHATLLVGFLLFGYALLSFLRWLKREVPEAPAAQPALAWSGIDEFVAPWLRHLCFALVLAHLLARPAAALFWPGRVQGVLAGSLTAFFLSLLLFFVFMGSVLRPPGMMDELLGPAYRRMEVRIGFSLLLGLSLLGLLNLGLELAVVDPQRHGAVALAAFVAITALACMRLPTAPRESL